MKPKPTHKGKTAKASGTDVTKDMKTFEALPEKTKVLARLEDETGKTTGRASVTLQKKIKTAAAD